MGIAVAWDDDAHRIVCNTFDREWAWDDFHNAKTQSFQLLAQANRTAAIVFIVPSDVLIPSNFVSHMSTLIRQIRERGSILVLVGGNPYLRSLLNVLESVTGRSRSPLYTFETLDQARSWILGWERSLTESKTEA